MKFLPFAPASKKKLRASAARRATAAGPEFEDADEPNMKLSRALLIVLVLHVVAVAGIIAFNAIKSRQAPVAVSSAATPTPAPPKAQPVSSVAPTPSREVKQRASASAPRPEKKRIDSSGESGKSYTVAKGDTPVSIARKFKVPFDDLLAANHIDDPRKLKIGQKLVIPVKAPRAKKGSE